MTFILCSRIFCTSLHTLCRPPYVFHTLLLWVARSPSIVVFRDTSKSWRSCLQYQHNHRFKAFVSHERPTCHEYKLDIHPCILMSGCHLIDCPNRLKSHFRATKYFGQEFLKMTISSKVQISVNTWTLIKGVLKTYSY